MSRVGKYRHRVDIQARIVSGKHPTTGEPVRSWQPWKPSVPAEVLTGPGKGELVAGNAERATADARVNLPWFPGLTAEHRIVWGVVIYDIKAIEYDATARDEIRLICQTGVRNG